MVSFNSGSQQDTVRGRNQQFPEAVRSKHGSDSLASEQISDTVSFCGRNNISDVSFYYPDNLVATNGLAPVNRFPYIFTERSITIENLKRETLMKHLKPGLDLPVGIIHDDWIIIVLLFAFVLLSVVRATSKRLLSGTRRFFLFTGTSDPPKSKSSGLLQWQAILLNLISFIILSLFIYYATLFYKLLPIGINGIFIWLIVFSGFMLGAGFRFILCLVTGRITGENEVFSEYLFGVNMSYRFSAMFLFLLILLMCYTLFFPVAKGITAGIIIFSLMYLVRVFRLLMIFINSNISIFYFILYLCALEILPVLILVKYFTGKV